MLGIAAAADVKKAGRVGLKSLVYFEVVSAFTLALGTGLLKLNVPIRDTPSSVSSHTDTFMKAIDATNVADLNSDMLVCSAKPSNSRSCNEGDNSHARLSRTFVRLGSRSHQYSSKSIRFDGRRPHRDGGAGVTRSG